MPSRRQRPSPQQSLTGRQGSAVDSLASGMQPFIQPLTDPELEFLDELGHLARTPRSAKRMFNLSRMSRSARNDEEASEFLGPESTGLSRNCGRS